MMEKIMTSAELAKHKVTYHGRDYSRSDDGYGDMEVAGNSGWQVIPSWGLDGWDLGSWPYVAIYARESNDGSITDGKLTRFYELQQIVEGDHTVWSFATSAERESAINYMFLWYAADQDWAPLKWEDREKLDRGEMEFDSKYLGPFSWSRLDKEREA